MAIDWEHVEHMSYGAVISGPPVEIKVNDDDIVMHTMK